MKHLAVRGVSGRVIAEYPDFAPGTAVRVLPAIVSNNFPTDRRIVDDHWSFAGPTRLPEYAEPPRPRPRHHRDRTPPSTATAGVLEHRPPTLSLDRVTSDRQDAAHDHSLTTPARSLTRPAAATSCSS